MWLRSNKLSLNIQKSSFVNLSSSTKKDFLLILENKCLNQQKVYKTSQWCLHWLKCVMEISDSSILTKIKRSVGTLSKIRYYVDINVLSNLYYALIYPFFDLWNNRDCVGQHYLFNNSPTSLYFTEKSYSPYDIYKVSWTLESYI